jgi:hypothetical protein
MEIRDIFWQFGVNFFIFGILYQETSGKPAVE